MAIKSDSNRLRLSVFRSNQYVFAQIIDDAKGATLVSAGDFKSKGKTKKNGVNQECRIGIGQSRQVEKD